ncbi:MAG: AAA family ATPase [Acidimicrobiia bacterium]
MEVEVALAVSPRDWADALHRFLADHGGARVRLQVMGPEDAVGERYHVLVVDDITSFLTPRLVEQVQAGGRRVLGVYDPEEFPDGKHRLIEWGVDDVIEADAEPDEFLRVIGRLRLEGFEAPAAPAQTGRAAGADPERGRVTVVGAPMGGCGATEVAVGLACHLGRNGGTVLVDADDLAPAVAQRLGLPLHPNLLTAVDAAQHRTGRLFEALQTPIGAPVRVLAGLPSSRQWNQLRPGEVLDVVAQLAGASPEVVVNIGSRIEETGMSGGPPRLGLGRTILEAAGTVLVVGAPTPVGVVRLLDWIAELEAFRPGGAVHVAVNRAPVSRYKRGEIAREVGRTYRPASLHFLPADRAVEAAAWEASPVGRGLFVKAVAALARSLEPGRIVR